MNRIQGFKCLLLLFGLTGSAFAQWNVLTTFPGLQNPAVFEYFDSTLYAGCYDGLYTSTDEGETWTHVPGPTTDFSIECIVAMDSSVFLSVPSGNGGFWCYRYKAGIIAGVSGAPYFYSGIQSGENLFLGSVGLYKSTDHGATWKWSHTGIVPNPNGELHVNSMLDIDGVILAGNQSTGVFRSTNQGQSWTASSAGLDRPGQYLNLASMLMRGSTILVTTYAGVYRSTDQGQNWSRTSLTLESRGLMGYGDYIFSMGSDGVFVSRDTGATWTISAGPASYITICCTRTKVFSIAWQGPIYWTLLENAMAVPENRLNIPTTTVLEQNYPNPFNPSTSIRFTLEHDSHVVLDVLNTLGQRIRRLVDQPLERGLHDAVFDGSDLVSGIYIYSLRTDGTRIAKKMLLLK